MMRKYPFSLQTDGLIVVKVYMNLDYEFQMVLDTGCSHTVLHTIEAKAMGYNLKKAPKTMIDTGSQAEYAKEINIDFIQALDQVVENMTVTVFDVNVERKIYVGYLGLDFFKGKKLLIDFEESVLCILE